MNFVKLKVGYQESQSTSYHHLATLSSTTGPFHWHTNITKSEKILKQTPVIFQIAMTTASHKLLDLHAFGHENEMSGKKWKCVAFLQRPPFKEDK